METANKPANRVLIIDDDVELCELVTEYLRREGMEAQAIHDGESGTQRALSGDYAVVVLDVMLPGIGGFEVLRRLRGGNGAAAHLPVLMLTARGDEVDRVLGLELGADDYLPKPFSSRELVARLRAILRRARSEPAAATEAATSHITAPRREPLRLDDLELDTATREVRRNGTLLELTSAEFDLLEVLLRAAGEIVTRETIAQSALGRQLMPYDRSIDVHISNLRRKLGSDSRGGERIKAVRGVGYIYARPATEQGRRMEDR
ncbi:MAG: two-component system, OmpR family, response regulator CpxR [Abditibacteriota bacterium]|nr:two-component system, OmpR family, response regulator CpxR [Abditibacteriota bacterium]